MTQVCSPEPNAVVLPEFRPFPALPPTNPDPSEIGPESWAGGERATRDMMSKIQPTAATHRRRKDVIQYVQSLITFNMGCQVFPYGSVPLKTYLPDGDIDLTVFTGSAQLEDVFVTHVHAVLKGEENNEAAQYHVKDVHRIDAEVKLVKCIVENMIVDISFDQLGGLCTLSFLEQVDQYIGKDHIFKRSIILIKAWCYYESRILGAHHGLISTYALETLVLYIFHLFHSSLDGPLTVLYRFLDYFSKFDWENYCVSLNGRVCKSSLPNIVAEVPDNGGDDVLLSEEFIRNCVYLFSVPSKRCETNLQVFPLKHLNIIDPLKENNNLGRSVNRGSFYRICSAFKYGARKLGWILSLPAERISDELNKFFANTLDRHESKCQTTVQNNTLLELGDDFDSHCLNRQFSLIGHKCATSPPLLPSPPLSPQQWKENPWDVTCEALQSQHNINSQTTVNGISWGTHAYHTNGSNFYIPPFKEEKNKPRGTGTYIPNVVLHLCFFYRILVTGFIFWGFRFISSNYIRFSAYSLFRIIVPTRIDTCLEGVGKRQLEPMLHFRDTLSVMTSLQPLQTQSHLENATMSSQKLISRFYVIQTLQHQITINLSFQFGSLSMKMVSPTLPTKLSLDPPPLHHGKKYPCQNWTVYSYQESMKRGLKSRYSI